MRNKFKILFVSPEVAPFAHTYEVGEFSGALPKYLKNLGHDIRVMMPNYKTIKERKYVLRDVIRLQGLEVKLGEQVLSANGKSAFIPDSKVQIYFLDNKEYFDRNGVYVDDKTGAEFKDNAERFLFFCKGCLETLKLLYWQPDIIHCNDWQTAFIPVLLKTVYKNDDFFKDIRTLLSVHDFEKRKVSSMSFLKKSGIAEALNDKWGEESQVNLLQLGIHYADMISTVSETYAEETLKGAQDGIAESLKERKNDLVGIVYGIDKHVWNPEADPLIPAHYTRQDRSGKVENKRALLQHFELNADENSPVIGMVSELSYEKGIELVLDAIDKLMKMNVSLIVSGKGDQKYEKKLLSLQRKYKNRIGVDLERNAETSHLIKAGSDILLKPSYSEPCGLDQLHSMTYGTIPVVRSTGGLSETIEEFNPETSSGTGFLFERFESSQLLDALERAQTVYNDQEKWQKLMTNAMKQDFSWNTSVSKYVKLYQKTMGTKK